MKCCAWGLFGSRCGLSRVVGSLKLWMDGKNTLSTQVNGPSGARDGWALWSASYCTAVEPRKLPDMAWKGDNRWISPPVMRGIDVFCRCCCYPQQLLNTQSSWRWFKTPWRSCDITLMMCMLTIMLTQISCGYGITHHLGGHFEIVLR